MANGKFISSEDLNNWICVIDYRDENGILWINYINDRKFQIGLKHCLITHVEDQGKRILSKKITNEYFDPKFAPICYYFENGYHYERQGTRCYKIIGGKRYLRVKRKILKVKN